jgi:hypothetical protein
MEINKSSLSPINKQRIARTQLSNYDTFCYSMQAALLKNKILFHKNSLTLFSTLSLFPFEKKCKYKKYIIPEKREKLKA